MLALDRKRGGGGGERQGITSRSMTLVEGHFCGWGERELDVRAIANDVCIYKHLLRWAEMRAE